MRTPSVFAGCFALLSVVLFLHATLLFRLSKNSAARNAAGIETWATSHRPHNRTRRQLQPSRRKWASHGAAGKQAAPSAAIPETVTLRSGYDMPSIGFGTAGLGEETQAAVLNALKAGYRLLDSAQAREWYREDLVGQAIAASGMSRESLFLTSKLHPRDLAQAATNFSQSLRDLNTTYLDLFMLHYPRCWGSLCGEGSGGTWQSAWRQLEGLVDQGKIRSLGICNVDVGTLTELTQMARIQPSVVQCNSDILRPNMDIQEACATAGIQFQGYSTLGTQWAMHGDGNPVLNHPVILGIAQKQNATAAHVALRWALQLKQAVIPRSRSVEHMKGNLAVTGAFSLTEQDMAALQALAEG